MSVSYDALIVGGGPAGLSAALILARCLRTAMICDAGQQRNIRSHAIHGLPGHDGHRPSDYLRAVRNEVVRYGTIRFSQTSVTAILRDGEGFTFQAADGSGGTARKILLATGLVDKLPNWPRIDEFYGRSVHHCLYCDGYECAGQPILAYGQGDKGAGLALMMRHWTRDVSLCNDGIPPTHKMLARLNNVGVPVIESRIIALEGQDGAVSAVSFANGDKISCRGIFFSTVCSQGSEFAAQLGCRRDASGSIVINPITEETSETGVYVAGDVTKDVLLIAVAIGEGVKAAVAINRALLTEEGFL